MTPLVQVVTFHEQQVKRAFVGLQSTEYYKAFAEIKERREDFIPALATAFANVHPQSDRRLDEILRTFFDDSDKYFAAQPVHWFWSEFFHTIAKDIAVEASCVIRIKACAEYYFYALEQNTPKGPILLHEPFYRFADPPDPDRPADLARDVRGIADTMLFFAPVLQKYYPKELDPDAEGAKRVIDQKRFIDQLTSLLRWFELRLEYTVSKWDKSNKQLDLALSHSVLKTKYLKIPGGKPVLMTSPRVREAMLELAEVWSSHDARSALLSASPGSGKEVLADFLIAARRLPDTQRAVLSAPELGTFAALRAELLKLPGIIDSVAGRKFLLFLDEIHHPAAGDLRAGLLRLMESRKLRLVGEDVVTLDHVLFLFAASLPPRELWECPPKDLWTRIEHTVRMRHPLRVSERDARNETLREYFLLFWTERTPEELAYGADAEVVQHDGMLPERVLNQLADAFTQQVSPLTPLVSMRVIRSVVKRLKNRTNGLLRTRPDANEEAKLRLAMGNFEDWMVDIFRELAPEIQGKSLY